MTMIDHVSIGARDVVRAKNFFDAALKPLGYSCPGASETSLGYGADFVAFVVDPDGDRVKACCGAPA